MKNTRCPTCKQPIIRKPSRICFKCSKPIIKHHKFFFVKSRIRHRNCKNPESYS